MGENIISCGLHYTEINNNTFDNVEKGVFLLGGSWDMVLGNTFINIPSADIYENQEVGMFSETDTYGILSVLHTGFEIYNNEFIGASSTRPDGPEGKGSYGIVVDESDNISAYSTENEFKGLDYGISTQGYNPFLQINCNLFANDGVPHNATAWGCSRWRIT